jgi:DNA-binding NtrC family response regulator
MAGGTRQHLSSAAREMVANEVLVVDADATVQKGMLQLLAPAGLHVTAAATHDQALELIAGKFFGVVVLDLDTPAPGGGLALVKRIHDVSPTSLCLVLTARKSFEAAVQAFRAGAHDVIMKAPDQVEYLKAKVLDSAGGKRKDATLLRDVRDSLEEFIKRLMEVDRRAVDLEDRLAGRDPSRGDVGDEIRILCVDSDDRLFKTLKQAGAGPTAGFTFEYAQSGGEALDRVTSGAFHIALVGQHLPDLPGPMVISAIKTQAPEIIVVSYELGGKLEIVETTRSISIVSQFTAAAQLTDRLGEVAEAQRGSGPRGASGATSRPSASATTSSSAAWPSSAGGWIPNSYSRTPMNGRLR